jgi:ornithine carbamoyltransferase
MQDKMFKATTIVTPDVSNRLVLEEAFNIWSEETKPTSILHVHYYHDPEAHVRGYQVVYEEGWTPYLAPEITKEEETARLLV